MRYTILKYFKFMLMSFRKNFKVTYLKLNRDTTTVYRNREWAMMKFCAGGLPHARYLTKITFHQRRRLQERCRFVEFTGQMGTIGCVWEKSERTSRTRISLSYVFRFTLQSMVKVSPTIFSRMLFRRHQVSPTMHPPPTCTDFCVSEIFRLLRFERKIPTKTSGPKYSPRMMKSPSTAFAKVIFIFIQKKYPTINSDGCSCYWWKFYRWLLCNFSFSSRWRGREEIERENFFIMGENWSGSFYYVHFPRLSRGANFSGTLLLSSTCRILILNRVPLRDDFRLPKFPVAVIFFIASIYTDDRIREFSYIIIAPNSRYVARQFFYIKFQFNFRNIALSFFLISNNS